MQVIHKLPSAFGTKLLEHDEQKFGTEQLMQLYILQGMHRDELVRNAKPVLQVEHIFGCWHTAQLEIVQ